MVRETVAIETLRGWLSPEDSWSWILLRTRENRDSCSEACFPLRVIGEENPFVLLSVARVLKLHAKDVSVLCRRLRG